MKRRLQAFLLARPKLYVASRRAFGIVRYLLRSPHEEDFRYFKRFAGSDGLFLDVGANSGISALAYRIFDRSSTIVSIEPNPYHEGDHKIVRRLIGKDFRSERFAAGDTEGAFTLHVPIFRGIPLTGDASLHREEALGSYTAGQLGATRHDLEVSEVHVTVKRLDDLHLSPHAIKIDVQGHELAALKGLSDTLERSRPVLMIEASQETERIAGHLAPLGYEPKVYDAQADHLAPYTGQAVTNVFFVTGRSPRPELGLPYL